MIKGDDCRDAELDTSFHFLILSERQKEDVFTYII